MCKDPEAGTNWSNPRTERRLMSTLGEKHKQGPQGSESRSHGTRAVPESLRFAVFRMCCHNLICVCKGPSGRE